jgi:hypothetical protein
LPGQQQQRQAAQAQVPEQVLHSLDVGQSMLFVVGNVTFARAALSASLVVFAVFCEIDSLTNAAVAPSPKSGSAAMTSYDMLIRWNVFTALASAT